MGSFDPRIGSQPPDPYEGYRAEAIEREKREKEALQKKKKFSKKLPLLAFVLTFFQKISRFFEKEAKLPPPPSHSASAKELAPLLLSFQEALRDLQKGDKSQDIPFVTHLSHLWHQIVEKGLYLDRSTPLSHQLKALFKELHNYPPQKSHTFGYYLSEYAGEKWLPFPYMEILQKLHHEHLLHQSASSLSHWIERVQRLRDCL